MRGGWWLAIVVSLAAGMQVTATGSLLRCRVSLSYQIHGRAGEGRRRRGEEEKGIRNKRNKKEGYNTCTPPAGPGNSRPNRRRPDPTGGDGPLPLSLLVPAHRPYGRRPLASEIVFFPLCFSVVSSGQSSRPLLFREGTSRQDNELLRRRRLRRGLRVIGLENALASLARASESLARCAPEAGDRHQGTCTYMSCLTAKDAVRQPVYGSSVLQVDTLLQCTSIHPSLAWPPRIGMYMSAEYASTCLVHGSTCTGPANGPNIRRGWRSRFSPLGDVAAPRPFCIHHPLPGKPPASAKHGSLQDRRLLLQLQRRERCTSQEARCGSTDRYSMLRSMCITEYGVRSTEGAEEVCTPAP